MQKYVPVLCKFLTAELECYRPAEVNETAEIFMKVFLRKCALKTFYKKITTTHEN